MQKPRITIYKINDSYLAYCPEIQKHYTGLFPLKTTFKLLSLIYQCQKDDNGNYLNLPLDKPVFD